MLKLTDKVDYVIDGEMLDWYLDHGLKLEDITIKQKLEYSKRQWLKPYSLSQYSVDQHLKTKMHLDNVRERIRIRM